MFQELARSLTGMSQGWATSTLCNGMISVSMFTAELYTVIKRYPRRDTLCLTLPEYYAKADHILTNRFSTEGLQWLAPLPLTLGEIGKCSEPSHCN